MTTAYTPRDIEVTPTETIITSVRSYAAAVEALEEIEAAGCPLQGIVIKAHDARLVPAQSAGPAIRPRFFRSAAVGTVIPVSTVVILEILGWLDPLVSLVVVVLTVVAINLALAMSFVALSHLARWNDYTQPRQTDIAADGYDLVATDARIAKNARHILK
jgi:hypothetical protein